jgi:hypothetical protein
MNGILTKKGYEIDRDEMLKADSYHQLVDKVNARLEKKYASSKIKYVWEVQRLFNDADLEVLSNGDYVADYSSLINKLRYTIEWKADWLEKKYRSVRLSFHDFEAELWKITYDAIKYYEESSDIETEFTLVETLEMWWKTRIINYIKSCIYTEKHGWWYKSKSLPEGFIEFWADDSLNPENQYIINETMMEILTDASLSTHEKALLSVIYDNPSDSYRTWGGKLGISHPQTIKRLHESIKKKLEIYNIYI